MNKHVKNISARLSLRTPQKDSLEILADIIDMLELKKHEEASLKLELEKVQASYPSVSDFERDFPSLCFALATGVGKTRLMGAFISYLYIQKGMKNFFVLAPNLTIYNKLIQDFTPGTPKYVFKGIAEIAANEPRIITGDNYDSGKMYVKNSLFKEDEIHINIFNISKINAEVRGGKAPRIKRLSEYIGESYFEYLSSLPDLVLLMDESHRYRATAGVNVLNELKPVIGLELTATPQVESSTRSIPFENVIYSYPLHKAMEDGYVKEPTVATRENFNASDYTQEQLEQLKLADGVRIHEETKTELDLYSRQTGQPLVKPFVLVVAQDTDHAEELLKYIESDEFYAGQYKGKVITVHSNQRGEEKDETIAELMALEDPNSTTEIVIHVNMLKEGWDVTNLYTIIPLRAANSKTLVEQSIGRGLRLPYGRRTENEAVDRLTIVAHDRFQDIIDEANNPNSVIRKGVIIGKDVAVEKKEAVTITTKIEETIQQEVQAEVDKIIENKPEAKETFTTNRVNDIVQATQKAMKKFEYLPSSKDLQKPEVQAAIVKEVKEDLNTQELDLFPEETEKFVAHVVATSVNNHVQHSIDIPRVIIQPVGDVTWGYKEFQLDVKNIHLQSTEGKIVIQNLRTSERSTLNTSGMIYKQENLADYIIEQLMNYSDISYDDHAELLYNLVGQLIKHLQSYLADDEAVENVLAYNSKQLASHIHEQMQEYYYQTSENEYDVKISKGYEQLGNVHYTMVVKDGERNFRNPVEDKSKIRSMVFSGFSKSLYRVQKFDSDSERKFAVICENDPKVLKWFKPMSGQLKIYYGRGETYHPDFVVETDELKFICEIKAESDMQDEIVLEKAKAVTAWCEHASKHELEHDGKEWVYLLIPHTNLNENMTVDGLKNKYYRQYK
ncbi:DEAD/DEAH box helicase family protein [Lysinibacillus sp. NPDC098008]|uniref:DEAD/DEAH box helicase family protein n=1 Tax=Lysinibacillus sp. NPDC098008 TaxID=3364146 RepID=UPI003803C64C